MDGAKALLRLAAPPAWLLERITASGTGRRAATVTAEEKWGEGQRNERLTSLGGTMRRRGMSREGIQAALLEESRRRCDPPLPEAEVMRRVGAVETCGGNLKLKFPESKRIRLRSAIDALRHGKAEALALLARAKRTDGFGAESENLGETRPDQIDKTSKLGTAGAAVSAAVEIGPAPAELARASAVLDQAGIRIMELEDGATIGVWSDLDGSEVWAALCTLGMGGMPVRYLDGAGVPMRYKVRRMDGEPVPMNVAAEMERHPTEPWKVRDRMLNEWAGARTACRGRSGRRRR